MNRHNHVPLLVRFQDKDVFTKNKIKTVQTEDLEVFPQKFYSFVY